MFTSLGGPWTRVTAHWTIACLGMGAGDVRARSGVRQTNITTVLYGTLCSPSTCLERLIAPLGRPEVNFREVHGDAPLGKSQSGISDGGAHSLARLLHRVQHPDDRPPMSLSTPVPLRRWPIRYSSHT